MSNSPKPSLFSSTLGTVLTMAGVAIGLGNIWRFPYMMGQYGGVVFLLAYLIIVFAFGVPGLMVEWSLGRYTRNGPWKAFTSVNMPGARFWRLIILITVTMAASYYCVVIGWVLQEAIAFVVAAFSKESVASFDTLTDGVFKQLIFLVITVVIGSTIIALGVRGGIERVSKIAIPLFFLLFVILVVRVLMLDNAYAGLREFFKPQWQNLTGRTLLAAMGQAIFSLGLGGMFMVRYGSYMRAEEDIPKGALFTALADTSAALLAGLIIVPAVYSFGMDLQGGPSLMFIVLPEVFDKMPAGAILGATFFFCVFVVAVLSLVAAYEIIVTAGSEMLGWSRMRSLSVVAITQVALALPAYLVGGYIAKSDLIWGSTMQPFGAGIAVVALTWSIGRSITLGEMRKNSRLPVKTWLFYWMKYVLPIAILSILIYGWIG